MAFLTTLAISTALANGTLPAPICDAGGPYFGVVNEPIQFDGTRSVPIPPHVIVLYEWNFGDGAKGIGPMPTHAYASTGAFVVELIVTDDDQAQSQCFSTAEASAPTPVDPSTWGRIKSIYRD